MTEKRFWEIVKIVNWGKDYDYERIRIWMSKNLSLDEIKAFRKILDSKWSQLDKVVGERNPAGGGDDSHSDLLYHVIGLGKKVFEANLADYMLLAKRGDAKYGSKEGYTESFSYAVPYEDDYRNFHDENYFPNWAKNAKTEILGLLKMDKRNDLSPVRKEFVRVANALDNVINGTPDKFLADAVIVRKSLDKIDKFFHTNKMELPRKFTDNGFNGYNIHYVRNLVSDMIARESA